MDKQPILDKPAPQLRDLAAGETFAITGRRGMVVRVLQGRAWITQESDPYDYVVPSGARYQSGGKGRIVVNAVADDTRIALYHVAPLPVADWARNAVRVDADFVEKTRHAAEQERAEYFADLIIGAWCRVQRAWSSLAQSRSHGAAPPLGARRYNR
jgi:hypothetical protein